MSLEPQVAESEPTVVVLSAASFWRNVSTQMRREAGRWLFFALAAFASGAAYARYAIQPEAPEGEFYLLIAKALAVVLALTLALFLAVHVRIALRGVALAFSAEGIEARRGDLRELHDWSWLLRLREEPVGVVLVFDPHDEAADPRVVDPSAPSTRALLRMIGRHGAPDVARVARRLIERG